MGVAKLNPPSVLAMGEPPQACLITSAIRDCPKRPIVSKSEILQQSVHRDHPLIKLPDNLPPLPIA